MREKTLYREFGVNAEFLIDHAWGQEPCTIAEIHAYEPKGHSLVNGQVLPSDYAAEEARMVMREMVDASALDLVARGSAAGRIDLHVGYARRKGGEAPPGAAEGRTDGGATWASTASASPTAGSARARLTSAASSPTPPTRSSSSSPHSRICSTRRWIGPAPCAASASGSPT